jgi:hypothetical protein
VNTRPLIAVLPSPLAEISRELAAPAGPFNLWDEDVGASVGSVSPGDKALTLCGSRVAMVRLACRAMIDHVRASSRSHPDPPRVVSVIL